MKKYLMMVLFALVTTVCLSQERVNRTKLSFLETSGVFDKARGWTYNEKIGEWVDYDNILCEDKDFKDKYKSLNGTPYMMSKNKNFNTIQLKTFNYNNQKYYALVWNRWTGYYKYPAIREDWNETKETSAYIFDEKEFNNLKQYKTITIYRSASVNLRFDDEEKLVDEIYNTLTKEKSTYSNDDNQQCFFVKLSNEGNVRFFYPTYKSLMEDSRYTKAHYDTNKQYFETTKSEFNKLLDLK